MTTVNRLNSDKLYQVTLKGMTYSATGIAYGVSYVIAADPTAAYTKLRAYLDLKDLGYPRDRELDKIALVAEEFDYTDCGHLLLT